MTNPSRIAQRFASLRRTGEMGLVAYLTAGDPSLVATEKFVLALADAGADVIELGVPVQRSCGRRPGDSARQRTRACAAARRLPACFRW